jgi:hypothetical protein
MIAILKGVRWTLNMVLICISCLVKDSEYFLMCFLAIWSSSFKKILFSLLTHFFIGSMIWGNFF